MHICTNRQKKMHLCFNSGFCWIRWKRVCRCLTVIFSAYRLLRVYTWLQTWNMWPSIIQAHMHAHTSTALPMLYRCAFCKILISCIPAVVSACSPISTLTCSSSSDSHIHIHFLLCLLQRLLLPWEPQHTTGRPMFPEDWENPISDHVGGFMQSEHMYVTLYGKYMPKQEKKKVGGFSQLADLMVNELKQKRILRSYKICKNFKVYHKYIF